MNHRKSNQFINNEKVTGSNSGWGDLIFNTGMTLTICLNSVIYRICAWRGFMQKRSQKKQ